MRTVAEQNMILLTVLNFLLTADEPIEFLRCWMEGDFETVKEEWPEFNGYTGDTK